MELKRILTRKSGDLTPVIELLPAEQEVVVGHLTEEELVNFESDPDFFNEAMVALSLDEAALFIDGLRDAIEDCASVADIHG